MFVRKLLGVAAFAGLSASAAAQSPVYYGTTWRPVQASAAEQPGMMSPSITIIRQNAPSVTEIRQVAATEPSPLPADIGSEQKPAPPSVLPDVSSTASTPPVAPTPMVSPGTPAASIPTLEGGTCAPTCSTCIPPCGPPGRVWVSAEWLFWAATGQHLPPIATTSPVGTDRSLAGVLPSPNTNVLYGGDRANNDFRNGLRINGGVWLDDNHLFGIEGNFFFLGGSKNAFATSSNGSQIISRPFFNALTGLPDAELVSYPGVLAGSLTAESRSSVIGGGVNAVHNLCCNPCSRIDLLYGYRYFNVSDEIDIRENLTALSGQGLVPAGTQYQIVDKFKTQNNFNGGVIGLNAEERFGMFFVGARASVALGANNEVIDINGVTRVMPPNGPAMAYVGGLLAQPSNIGHYNNTVFAVMPELGLRAGVQVTQWARVFAGYNFLYLSNVARAGDQIDLRVNPTQLPPRTLVTGPNLPAFTPHTTDFTINGFSLGVELRF